jgi:hypothetical protein
VQLAQVSVEIEDDDQSFNLLEALELDTTKPLKKERSVDLEFILCVTSWTDFSTSAKEREIY